MYSTHNKGIFVVAERFIRTLKNKIYKCMTSVSKNVYFYKLVGIVNNYNNTYHSTIKMKPTNVKSSTCIDFNKENNRENPKSELGDHVIISKYKKFFAKGNTSNYPEKLFVIKKVKSTVPWTYVISDPNGIKIVGKFYEKELQKNKSKRVKN